MTYSTVWGFTFNPNRTTYCIVFVWPNDITPVNFYELGCFEFVSGRAMSLSCHFCCKHWEPIELLPADGNSGGSDYDHTLSWDQGDQLEARQSFQKLPVLTSIIYIF